MTKEDKTERVLAQAQRGRRYKKIPMDTKACEKLLDTSNKLLANGQQAEGVDITWRGRKKRYDDVSVEVVYPTFEQNGN